MTRKHPKWILKWGIHNGTYMSRDCGTPILCRNLKHAHAEVIRLKENFKKYGYNIWFATAYRIHRKGRYHSWPELESHYYI